MKPRGAASPAIDESQPGEREASGRAKAIVFRLAAVALGLLMPLLATEVAFRLLGVKPARFITKRLLVSPDQSVNYFCYPTNPNREFVPLPPVTEGNWQLLSLTLPPRPLPLSQLVETPWCVEYRLSSQGLRDRPYGPVPPGVLRIAGVGDSFVAGEGVPLGLSLCKQLEQLLGSGYEVVNAGRPGLGTQGELARWRSLAPLGCRRAIVVFIANDVDVTAPLQQRQAYINDLINIRQENLDRIYGRPSGGSRLLEYARQKLLLRDITRDTVQWYLDCYSDENRNNVARLEQAIRDFAANPDCPVVFVLYPLLENLERGYPLQRIHDLVGGMLQGAGIAYLDLAATFQGQDTRSLWVHDVDHHPNGKAHRLAAEAIARWLKREQPWFLESPR